MEKPSINQSRYFPLGSHFITNHQIKFIEEKLKEFPLEMVTYGDAGELNKCKVGRLVEDLPNSLPKIVNKNLSKPLLDIFESEEAKKFFEDFLGVNQKQIIRRSQFNLLEKNAFVGRHLDVDSNPDYEIACVLQLGSNFTGGEFIVYPEKSSKEVVEETQIIKPEYGSLTISFCNAEHEVKKVLTGIRTSFVVFICSNSGYNKRK